MAEKKKIAKITFEQAMKRLGEISGLMNNDELPLEDALKLYSEASELIVICKKEMNDAQLVLKELFIG